MHLVRVGRLALNLDYLIEAEDLDDGGIRLTLERGCTRDFPPPEAETIRARLRDFEEPRSHDPASQRIGEPIVTIEEPAASLDPE